MSSKGTKRGWFEPPSEIDAQQPPERSLSLQPNTSETTSSKKHCTDSKFRKSLSQNDIMLSNTKIKFKNFNSSNWIENFAPSSIADLALHQKKIEDVHAWLEVLAENKLKNKEIAPILLLTGPAGCGKTIMLKLIAESLKYNFFEWTTPQDIDLIRYNDYDAEDDNPRFTYQENQADQFEEFLRRCSRSAPLFATYTKRLIFVKDFPNIFLKKPELFHQCLERYLDFGKAPLIFSVTDTNSKTLNIAYNLFPEQVRIKCMVDEIVFNPVAVTFMKKALKRIVGLMAQPGFSKFYKPPTPEMLESIIVSAQGDLRNAVINLHFSSQLNAVALKTEVSYAINPTKKSKKPEKNSKLKSIGKDSNITLMHALGRVFYPKFVDNFDSNATINAERPKVFHHPPEEIAEQFLSQPSNFVSFIFTNYPGYFTSIDDCLLAADTLSCVELFLADYRNENISEMGLHLAVRGVMVANETPAGGKRTIKGYKKLRSNDADIVENRRKLSNYDTSLAVASNQLALEYKSFMKIIQKGNLKI